MADQNNESLRDHALSAAQAGSTVAAAGVLGALRSSYKTSHRDVVTDIDIAAENAILTYLQNHRPADAILGEELGQTCGTSNVRWIIDPIDGTSNFVRGRSEFATAVAASINDAPPSVGAIIRPSTGRWMACDKASYRTDSSWVWFLGVCVVGGCQFHGFEGSVVGCLVFGWWD